jgi:hypothetical protein
MERKKITHEEKTKDESNLERKIRLEYLIKSKERLERAIEGRRLRLTIEKITKEKDYGWSVRIIDNLGGISFLQIPILEAVKKRLPSDATLKYDSTGSEVDLFGESRLKNNSAISSWTGFDPGLDCGNGISYPSNGGSIFLFEPHTYVTFPPEGHLDLLIDKSVDLKTTIVELKKKLKREWDNYSALYNEIYDIQTEIESENRERLQRRSREKEEEEESKAIALLKGKTF